MLLRSSLFGGAADGFGAGPAGLTGDGGGGGLRVAGKVLAAGGSGASVLIAGSAVTDAEGAMGGRSLRPSGSAMLPSPAGGDAGGPGRFIT